MEKYIPTERDLVGRVRQCLDVVLEKPFRQEYETVRSRNISEGLSSVHHYEEIKWMVKHSSASCDERADMLFDNVSVSARSSREYNALHSNYRHILSTSSVCLFRSAALAVCGVLPLYSSIRKLI